MLLLHVTLRDQITTIHIRPIMRPPPISWVAAALGLYTPLVRLSVRACDARVEAFSGRLAVVDC